ncbi:MAG TPA: methyltransferase domain-containing protein [Stellaceae bacterium]|nr:methyltransferase domain-containing protein [Stellaceae bacterium]
MIRFGKSAAALAAHKQNFFHDNEALIENARRIATIYVAQPRRTHCKCCAHPLGPPQFVKDGIAYAVCDTCGHLNGAHEDSDEFCAALYTEGGGADYARAYSASGREAFWLRVRDIYVPKAAFLRDALAEREAAEALTYADLGAGSGYFVAALREVGLTNAAGYEVSEAQVDLANAMLGAETLHRHDLAATIDVAATVAADAVSMIGVLEHVPRPREVLGALKANPRVRYLFVSVPLFSPCVFFEMAFPGVFHRQLSGAHTHLFTERSLDWTAREFGMERVAEWWFGTDIFDLLRAVGVALERRDEVKRMASTWNELFAPAVDDLQLALDRRKLASEVHLLLRFAN